MLLPPKLTTDQRVPAFLSFLPRTPPSLCSWRVLGFSWKISGKRRELCSRLCHRGAGDVKIILILVTLGPFQRRETAHQYDEPAPGREGKAGWSAQGTPWSFPLRTPGLKGQSHGKSPTSAFFFKLKGSRFCHHKILMLETCPLYTGADLNLRDRVLDEVGKNSLLLYQAKGDTAGLCPQTLCPDPEVFGEEFRSSGSRVPLCGGPGCVQGLPPLTWPQGGSPDEHLWFSGLPNCDPLWKEGCLSSNIFICWGLSSVRSLKTRLCIHEAEPEPWLQAAQLLLAAPSLSLRPLPSLISNFAALPFRIRGRSSNGGHRKDFMPRSPTES